jgi:hypothetical protein
MTDARLFGAALGDPASWATWQATLKADEIRLQGNITIGVA